MQHLENIIQERIKKPFTDLLDFCKRIDLRTSNKRVIENLISAGAFDEMPGNRAQKNAEVATIIDQATDYKKHQITGQLGLFGAFAAQEKENEFYAYQPRADWADKEKLKKN